MQSCHNFMKYSLFAFNAIVSIIAAIVIFNGVILKGVMEELEHSSTTTTTNGISNNSMNFHFVLPTLMLTIGCFVLLVSLCGCCGALRESIWDICCYATFMLVLLLAEGVMCSIMWGNKDHLINAFDHMLKDMWKFDINEFHVIEHKLHCCGVNGVTDYLKDLAAPPSVCCPGGECNGFNYYSGCSSVVLNLFTTNVQLVKHVAVGLIIAEILGFLFACILCNNIRSRKRQSVGGVREFE